VSSFPRRFGPGILVLLMCLIGTRTPSGSALAAWPTITSSEEDDERVDEAIERALAHLAKIQEPDGAFDKASSSWPGLTGLAAMSFLAKGYLPGLGKYGDTLNRSVDWVLAKAEKNNNTGLLSGGGGGQMYSQGICTLFLTEVSGMLDRERQEKVDMLLPKAVQVILTSEVGGGWSYVPSNKLGDLTKKDWMKGSTGDLSISGWQLMSLRGARLNGAQVPTGAIEAGVKYVLNHHDEDEGTFGYHGKSDHAKTLTGAGILCLELCGQHDENRTRKSARYLMNNYTTLPGDSHGTYGLYYTSQGLFQLGGPVWDRFSNWMYTYFIGTQQSDGSWGDVKNTSFVTLAFAVPYRMLPIYQRDETVDEK
jgi:hypothetical protein